MGVAAWALLPQRRELGEGRPPSMQASEARGCEVPQEQAGEEDTRENPLGKHSQDSAPSRQGEIPAVAAPSQSVAPTDPERHLPPCARNTEGPPVVLGQQLLGNPPPTAA